MPAAPDDHPGRSIALAPAKRHLKTHRYGRTKPGTLLKHHIPFQADHWEVRQAGFTELAMTQRSHAA